MAPIIDAIIMSLRARMSPGASMQRGRARAASRSPSRAMPSQMGW
jgi:hypothetical protein